MKRFTKGKDDQNEDRTATVPPKYPKMSDEYIEQQKEEAMDVLDELAEEEGLE